jgi:hypothetical protein
MLLSTYKAPAYPSDTVDGRGNTLKVFDDGSAAIEDQFFPIPEKKDAPSFYSNLVEFLDPTELRNIGGTLSELIKKDIESQLPFRKSLADIIKLLGLALNKSTSTESDTVELYSTALYETVCHIIACASDSLIPSQGISKTVIYGQETDNDDDTASRIDYFYDYYFNEILKDFKKEQVRTFFWAIMAGSAYKKVYIDPLLNRPVSNFIRVEDFVINRDYSTHFSSPRKTHILRLSKREFDYRKHLGMYADVPMQFVDTLRGDDGEETVIQEILEQISGTNAEDGGNPEDGGYVLYECHVNFLIKSDPQASEYKISLPYVITLDAQTQQVCRIVRNWDEKDFLKKNREYFVNYSLLPSLDGEGYGMVHYASGSAEASTSIQRLILKAATYASFPAGVYSAGTRLENNAITPQPGQYLPLNAGGLKASDIVESLPYRDPSPLMMELKREIEDSIKKPSAIVNDVINEMAPRAPTGSVLAVLETLQRVPNLILKGFHESFGQELELFKARFFEWLEPGQQYPFMVPGGEHVLMKEDFSPHHKIYPSSDPSMQNSAYRLMLYEILVNKANEAPDLHNRRAAYEFFYKNLGLTPEKIDKLLLPAPEEERDTPLDPVHENANVINGQPVKAFIFQDHQSHITVHNSLLQNEDPAIVGAITAHIKEHTAFNYILEMQARMGVQLPENMSELPPEQQNQYAMMEAQAALQQQQEQQAQNPPPEPPIDPGRAMLEDSKLKAQTAQEKIQFDMQELQANMEMKAQELQVKRKEMQTKLQLAEYELQQKDAQFNVQMQLKQMEMEFKVQLESLKSELANKKMELDAANKERLAALQEKKAMEDALARHQEREFSHSTFS